MPRLIRAETPEHWQWAQVLFKEYASSLDFDLDFQGFDQELETLPEDYGPPTGACFSHNRRTLLPDVSRFARAATVSVR